MSRLSIPPLLLFFLLLPIVTFASVHRCVNQPEVIVYSDNQETIAEICHTSERAIRFLSDYGVTPKRDIRFRIIEERIDSHGYIAYGSYDSRSDSIQLMSYASILAGAENPTMYGEPFDRVHYSGAIAHEVSHAVVQHNLLFKPLSTGPQEYLAHSTQLAVIPEERRSAILRAMDVESWQSGDAISDIYMAIEPGKFAVKSYLHLTTMKDPVEFVKMLLNAKWFYVYVP